MTQFENLNEQLQKLNEKIEQLLNETMPICEMSEKQGFDDYFVYYTLDGEYRTHYPHVHICVPKDDKSWEGKILRSGNPLKSVASVKLDKSKNYTIDNLEFEEIKDDKILSIKYKKDICKWLNSNFNGKRKSKTTNAYRCMDSYIMNNEDGYFNDEVQEILDNED